VTTMKGDVKLPTRLKSRYEKRSERWILA